MKTAVITIKDLKAQTLLGIYDWERKASREVVIHLAVTVDIAQAVVEDTIEYAVDYDTICNSVRALVEQSSAWLLEKLCHDIAVQVKAMPFVLAVEVEVEKPGALGEQGRVAVKVSC